MTTFQPRGIALVCGLLLTVAMMGCASSELISIRKDMSSQLPEARITEGRSFAFGTVSLGMARMLGSLVMGRDEPARVILRGVRRVHVGRYTVDGRVDTGNLRMPGILQQRIERQGWDHLATVREEGEVVWVLYRSRGTEITDLFVSVLSGDELVMTRVSGRLSSTLMTILEEGDVRLPALIPTSKPAFEGAAAIASGVEGPSQ